MEEDARGTEWELCQARGQGSLGGDSSCARDTMCLASSPGGSTNMGSQGVVLGRLGGLSSQLFMKEPMMLMA